MSISKLDPIWIDLLKSISSNDIDVIFFYNIETA